MKKINLAFELNRDTLRHLTEAIRRGVQRFFTRSLLVSYRSIQMVIVLLFFFGLAAGLIFLMQSRPVSDAGSGADVSLLRIEDIDALELWLEERAGARAQSITIPSDIW